MQSEPKLTENGLEIANWILANRDRYGNVRLKVKVKLEPSGKNLTRRVTLTRHDPQAETDGS